MACQPCAKLTVLSIAGALKWKRDVMESRYETEFNPVLCKVSQFVETAEEDKWWLEKIRLRVS